LVRKKGDKDYSQREKQLLISLINDYSLFGAHDDEIIQMLSKKIGKKISETLFYRLKKEVKTKVTDFLKKLKDRLTNRGNSTWNNLELWNHAIIQS
jgi:hypothetical protein